MLTKKLLLLTSIIMLLVVTPHAKAHHMFAFPDIFESCEDRAFSRQTSFVDDFVDMGDYESMYVTRNTWIRFTPSQKKDNIYALAKKNATVPVGSTHKGRWSAVLLDGAVFYIDKAFLSDKPPAMSPSEKASAAELRATTNNAQSSKHASKTQTEPTAARETRPSSVTREQTKLHAPVLPEADFRYYRVGTDASPPVEWEEFLYMQLKSRSIAWYYPYAVAQIYAESNWHAGSTNGRDHGLCQFKGIYWAARAAAAGLPGGDIWDPYDSMYVYAWFMSGLLNATGNDVPNALSLYITGVPNVYHADYVNLVMCGYRLLN